MLGNYAVIGLPVCCNMITFHFMGRESDWTDQEDQRERNEGQIDVSVSPSHSPILSLSLLLLLKYSILSLSLLLSSQPQSQTICSGSIVTWIFLLSSFPFLSPLSFPFLPFPLPSLDPLPSLPLFRHLPFLSLPLPSLPPLLPPLSPPFTPSLHPLPRLVLASSQGRQWRRWFPLSLSWTWFWWWPSSLVLGDRSSCLTWCQRYGGRVASIPDLTHTCYSALSYSQNQPSSPPLSKY